MEQIVSNFVPIFVDGFVETTLPNDVFSKIKCEVDQIKTNNFKTAERINQNLYGAIEHEYNLNVSSNLQKFIDIISRQYVETTKHFKKNFAYSQINGLWVNFQKKYEFNPVHNHTCCDLSFVVWIDIPYDVEEEKKLPHIVNSNRFYESATQFNFLYTSPYHEPINSYVYNVDKNSIGKLILFHSKLNHIVYPFHTSDDYRISVAGNVKLIYE